MILEAGAFGGVADWSLVARSLSASGKVCAYDREGLGKTTGLGLDPSPIAIARRLEVLVTREEGAARVILAGHSNGGLYVEAFARLWPERTAGLLMVDAVGTDVRDHPLALADLETERELTGLAPFARATGLSRLGPWLSEVHPPREAAARRERIWTRRSTTQTASAEVRAILDGLKTVDALPPLRPTIPVAVIVASRRPTAPLDRDWRAAQIEIADRACRSVVVDAWSSHTSILDAQHDYVVALVDWLNGGQAWVGKRACG
ncbi:hypothetical protein BH10PSE4_BH10PSE4_04710 [soil metagenome]